MLISTDHDAVKVRFLDQLGEVAKTVKLTANDEKVRVEVSEDVKEACYGKGCVQDYTLSELKAIGAALFLLEV